MDLRAVTTANDIGLATILKGLLESAGIEAVLSGGSEPLYPGTTVDAIRVLVRAEDFERATELLEQIEENGLEDEEDEE